MDEFKSHSFAYSNAPFQTLFQVMQRRVSRLTPSVTQRPGDPDISHTDRVSSDMCQRKLVLQNIMQEKTLVQLDFFFCDFARIDAEDV